LTPVYVFGQLIEEIFTRNIGGAIDRTVTAFDEAFAGISEGAEAAFGIISSALTRGDWSTAWEAVRSLAETVWIHIKFAGLATFNAWQDAITDTFRSIWTALKVGWISLWGDMQVMAFMSMANIISAMPPAMRQLLGLSGISANTFSAMALAAGAGATFSLRKLG